MIKMISTIEACNMTVRDGDKLITNINLDLGVVSILLLFILIILILILITILEKDK